MRRIRNVALIALVCLGLTSLITPANAANSAVDEQWPTPNTWQEGYYSIQVNDGTSFLSLFSRLQFENDGVQLMCTSIEDFDCAKSGTLTYNAVLPACTSDEQTNCISGLTAVHADGTVDTATFDYYTLPNHPNLYKGDDALKLPQPASPSAWVLPRTPHSAGTEYAMSVSLAGKVDRKQPQPPSSLSIVLSAVSRHIGDGGATDENGFENYPKCRTYVSTATGRRAAGCGIGAEEFGKYVCSFKMNTNGDCLLRQPFPPNVRFRLGIRLADRPSGWFHGRMSDPAIASVKDGQRGYQLTVEAAPTSVAVFYAGGDYSTLPAQVQDHFVQCLAANSCWHTSRNPQQTNATPLEKRNIMEQPAAYSNRAMLAMGVWMDYAKNTSVAVPSTWTMRTLEVDGPQGQNSCLAADSSGVKGIVTTNATAYSDGPPAFADRQLTYSVMAPHFRSDGTTPFLGTYNLVLRSDVARCLYGFSNAPLQAKIEVVDASGSQAVAVTTMSESNGWLSLAASGFTFSSPTISVQLSQEQPQVAKPTTPKPTITCVNTKTKKVTKVLGSKCPTGTKKR